MQELAVAKQQALMADEPSQYLTFSVLRKQMAIGILDVEEIIEVGDMTRVPMTNPSIRGVINLRGNVVPVVDLHARLGNGTPAEISARTCIVLVQIEIDHELHTMGMLVDQVNEILEIPEEAIQKTPDFGTDMKPEFIRHMGRVNNEFIILLNVPSVLSVEQLAESQHGPVYN
jgi:purine-binding chemotaxis protein CheW